MIKRTIQGNALPNEFADQIGQIIKVQGPILEMRFKREDLPEIFDTIAVRDEACQKQAKAKVAQRLKNGLVRCITTVPLSGLKPGLKVVNTGEPCQKPESDDTLKEALRRLGQPPQKKPSLLETGIKVIDLLCPYPERGNVGLLGGQGEGRVVAHAELVHNVSRQSNGLSIFYFIRKSDVDSVRDMLAREPIYAGDSTGTVETFYLLTDYATDPVFAAGQDFLDAITFFSPILMVRGLYPAINPLTSHSRLLEPAIVGKEHYDVAVRVRETLQRAKQLLTDPLFLEYVAYRASRRAAEREQEFLAGRMRELLPEDKILVSRARRLERFFSQPFHVAERYAGVPGKLVSRGETIRGCKAILDGEYDALPEEAFTFVGELGEVDAKAKLLQKHGHRQ